MNLIVRIKSGIFQAFIQSTDIINKGQMVFDLLKGWVFVFPCVFSKHSHFCCTKSVMGFLLVGSTMLKSAHQYGPFG